MTTKRNWRIAEITAALLGVVSFLPLQYGKVQAAIETLHECTFCSGGLRTADSCSDPRTSTGSRLSPSDYPTAMPRCERLRANRGPRGRHRSTIQPNPEQTYAL
jgi:hypothetical protein